MFFDRVRIVFLPDELLYSREEVDGAQVSAGRQADGLREDWHRCLCHGEPRTLLMCAFVISFHIFKAFFSFVLSFFFLFFLVI